MLTQDGVQATPVKINELGAHFEAYVNLLSTVDTLRLCQRFGKGENVAITRLPIEVLVSVQDNLIEEEREKLDLEWTEDLRCWESRCQIIDHFIDEERRQIYFEWFHQDFDPHAAERLHEEQFRVLGKKLGDGRDGRGDVGKRSAWRAIHQTRQDRWLERVGHPTEKARGFFSKHSQLMIEHFGLDTWISYTQFDKPKPGQWRERERRLDLLWLDIVLPDHAGTGRLLLWHSKTRHTNKPKRTVLSYRN